MGEPSAYPIAPLTGEQVTADDVVDALRLVPGEHVSLEAQERRLIETARDRGLSWTDLGERLGGRSPQAMQQRYKRLGGERSWPAGRRPAASEAQGFDQTEG